MKGKEGGIKNRNKGGRKEGSVRSTAAKRAPAISIL